MKTGVGKTIFSIAILFCWTAIAGCAASDSGPQTEIGDPTMNMGGSGGSYTAGASGYSPAAGGASGYGPGAGVSAGAAPTTAGSGGAAGAAPVAGGSSSAVGGSVGTPSDGGASPAAAGSALVTENGWVSSTTNSFGIQGAWYVFCDSCDPGKPIGTSSISPSGDSPYATSSTICASGSAGQVPAIDGTSPAEYDWEGPTWGAGIGLNLSQQEGDPAVNSYANPQGIKGFQVSLSGSVDGGTIRVKYQVAGNEATDYCKEVSVPGTHSVLFSDATASCWQAGGASPSPTSVSAIQFQVVSNEVAAKSFDFCVDSLSPVP